MSPFLDVSVHVLLSFIIVFLISPFSASDAVFVLFATGLDDWGEFCARTLRLGFTKCRYMVFESK